MAHTTTDLEIVTTRVVDASRERVFRAWTDPNELHRWWGPKGFTSTLHTHELRPEGTWDFTFHGPDGRHYHNTSVYRRIDAPHRLEFDHVKPMHRFQVTVFFEPMGHRTRIEWHMRFPTPEELDRVLAFVPAANEENLDRLEALLKQVS